MTPLAPRGDSLVKKTWRPREDIAAARANHTYPQAGCQGEPLSGCCSSWCGECRGAVDNAGRVLCSGWDTPHCG